jgi:predicted DNA-binding transcriptional regulator AlpA
MISEEMIAKLLADHEPVGRQEIAALAGVTPAAVDNWRYGKDDFPVPTWIIGGNLRLWKRGDVTEWLERTGRLEPSSTPADTEGDTPS